MERHVSWRSPGHQCDLRAAVGAARDSFRAGLECQYWKNKFGNGSSRPVGKVAFAHTPMVRLNFHFQAGSA